VTVQNSVTTSGNHLYVATTGSDSNPGTQSAPFRTIQKAANVVSAGTTVHVAPGTYAETITSAVNGTASARIRFVSDTKWGAKIVPVAGANTIWRASGGYTDIDGFQVDGTGNTSVRTGIALNGGNSSIKNTLAHHLAENSGCDSQGGAAMHSSQSRGATFNNYDFIGNVVHHVGAGCSWIQGIYHQSSGNIKNNIVYATTYAIHLYHDDHDTVIANNTLFGNSSYGIVYGGCQEGYTNPCPTSGIKIYNNIIYDNRGGIAGPVTAEDVNNIIKNNLVFGNTIQYDLASPSLSTITGTVTADPQFVNYIRTGGGDYHLKSTSPAIDKGSATYAPATDIDGVARPQGSAVDIGAYER
jgi:parallel beta-helix repeat protein